MRRVFELFPESVIIRSLDCLSKLSNYYTNDKFNSTIIDLKDLIADQKHKDILDSLDSLTVNVTNYDDTESSNSEVFITANEFLEQRESVIVGNLIASSTCKIFQDRDDATNFKILTVKTLKVNWEENPDSYLHVFIDNTDIYKLEQANNDIRCQKIMFASASHEFRTPLNAILNSFELIKLSFLGGDGGSIPSSSKNCKLAKYVKMGSTSAILLLSLIEDILNLSKFESGNFRIKNDYFNVGELIEEVDDMFSFQCEQKNLKLEFKCDKNLRETQINSDRGRIKQVFLNLLSNAVKFTFEGKIVVGARFLKTLSRSSRYIEFYVEDTGIGIKEDDQLKLFKLFGMISKSKTVNPNGCGIGLTVSKKYIEHMGGEMELTSKYGVGTKLKFTVKDVKAKSLKSLMIKSPVNQLIKSNFYSHSLNWLFVRNITIRIVYPLRY
jgi:signal transduction histidine kinase